MSWNDALDEFEDIDKTLGKIEATAIDALSQDDAPSIYASITDAINRLMQLKVRADNDITLAPSELAIKRWYDILAFSDLVITTTVNKQGRTLSVARSSEDAGYMVECKNGSEYTTEDL